MREVLMRTTHVLFFLLVGSMVWVGSVNAAVLQADYFLDGLQEDPPVPTTGTGMGSATFDTSSGLLSVSGTFQDLIGTSNNAHVHGYAPLGDSAGVIFGISFTNGATSGSFSGSGTIPSDRIDDVLAGLTYVNIHSTFRPGGEIRGQMTAWVPEPASVALLAMGVAGWFSIRRRSR
jgi:hypothetical protein